MVRRPMKRKILHFASVYEEYQADWTYICHNLEVSDGICPKAKDRAAATIVATPLVLYQSETRIGCSDRLYH